MRTTVELPQELMRQAKARAAAQGESLKTFLTRAVAAELGKAKDLRGVRTRVRLPLFGNPAKKPVEITGEDVAHALVGDDVIGWSRLKGPRKK